MAGREREEAALDALIVLALRGTPEDDAAVMAMMSDDIDPDTLPELIPEDLAAIEAIDINEIIARANARSDDERGKS